MYLYFETMFGRLKYWNLIHEQISVTDWAEILHAYEYQYKSHENAIL